MRRRFVLTTGILALVALVGASCAKSSPGTAGGGTPTSSSSVLPNLPAFHTLKQGALTVGSCLEYSPFEFVDMSVHDKWVVTDPKDDSSKLRNRVHTGIIFVPKVVDRTPPYVEAVEPNSPAAKAGLKPDDLVIYLDGEPVYSTDVFKDLLARYAPGDKVQVEIRRGDILTALSLELAPLPKQ